MDALPLLNDINIENIVAQLRLILQKNAFEIESDLSSRKSLEIGFKLKLDVTTYGGAARLQMEYVPLVRKDSASTKLEDRRQLTIVTNAEG